MKRNSHRRKKNIRRIRLILLLALIVPTSGWTVTKVAERFNIPIIIAQADKNSLDAIDDALHNLKFSQYIFLKQLANAIQDPNLRETLNSNELYNRLAVINIAINRFKAQNLSKYDDQKQVQINEILEGIKKNNIEVADKIIRPLQEGLSCDPKTGQCTNVQKVQQNLNSVEGTRLDVDGKLGTGTIHKIEEFILTKIDDSQNNFDSLKKIIELQSLPQPTLKTETKPPVDPLEPEQTDKNFKIISLLVTLALLIISLLPYIIILIKTKKLNRPSSNHQENFSNQSILQSPRVEESNLNQNEIYHQILTTLNQQIPSIVNRQIDLKLASIKYELREEIIESLRVNDRSNRAYSDVPPAPVEEKANYQSQRRDKNQSQVRDRNENIPQFSYQPVSSPLPRLVQTYNRDPRSLWKNALEVGETEASFNNRQSGKNTNITLSNRKRGIYAVIEERDNYFLIPSKHFRITDNNYKTIQAFFECREYQKDYSDRFYLVEPAKLSSMPDGKEWILEQKGILNFNPDYPVVELRKQLEKANKEKEQFQSKLEEIENEKQQLRSQVTKLTQRVNDRKDLTYSNVQSPPVEANQNSQSQPSYRNKNTAKSSYQAVSSPPPVLVETYNRDSRSSTRGAIEVSETQKSISDRSIGKSKKVTLETKNRGTYAILKEGSINYLVPSKYLRITDNNYLTVQALFECRNYKKRHPKGGFNLIKPAIVNTISANQQWQLQERGVLEFI